MNTMDMTRTAFAGLLIFAAPLQSALAAAPMPPAPGTDRRLAMMDQDDMMPPAAAMAPKPAMPPCCGGKMGAAPMGDAKMSPPAAAADPMAGPGEDPTKGPGVDAKPMRAMQQMMQEMTRHIAGMATGGQMPLPAGHMEGRIAFLRAELAITETQSKAWDEFAQALRNGHEHAKAAWEPAAPSADGAASAPDRLAAYQRHLSMQGESLKSSRESFQRLYVALTPEQKRAADELVVPVMTAL